MVCYDDWRLLVLLSRLEHIKWVSIRLSCIIRRRKVILVVQLSFDRNELIFS